MRNFFGLIGLLVALASAPAVAQEDTMKIYCGNKSLNIELANNKSAKAFAEKLTNGDITVKLSDYEDFEKTGKLGFNLPRSDENITTAAGDVILYLGNTVAIYYDTNSWNFTRIGRIPNMTREKMLDFFGGYGDVEVTFSVK